MTEPELNLQQLIANQRQHFASGATLPLHARRTALRRLRQAMISYEQPLLAALHADLRKPAHEAYAAEIALVLAEIDHAIKHLKAWARPRRAPLPWMLWPARASVMPRPMGVSLIMGPWNYPVQLLMLPLVGAIAAGNCAVVKPSELAPATATAIAHMLGDAFPAQFIAAVQGGAAIARQLLTHRFDKIFFTGGQTAGRAVALAAAEHLTPVTLELGGKCPVIVCAEANLRVAARRIIWAKTLNAGQTCVAPDYLLVQRSVHQPLVQEMVAALRWMFGSNVQASGDYGRIVNPQHFQRLLGYLAQGAVRAGGEHDATDLFLAPTLLENVPADAPLMHEEIFGPILPIVPFESIDDAIAIAGSKPPPLAVYLFTGNRSTGQRVQQQLPCGSLCVNDAVVQLFGQHLPFGGVGLSGMGRYRGRCSFDCFSHTHSAVHASKRIDWPFRYPPPRLPLQRLRKVLPWLLRS